MNEIQYPLGPFRRPDAIDASHIYRWIGEIGRAPAFLERAVAGLTDAQLDMPYRTGGWTPRQIVHHVADSHMNAYVRFKLGLTEEMPAVSTFEQARWAELPDCRLDTGVSLTLIRSLHERWTAAMEAVGPGKWQRRIRHPEMGEVTLALLAALYAWHGRHHAAQIFALREREGWGERVGALRVSGAGR